jgi:hypothetical protein
MGYTNTNQKIYFMKKQLVVFALSMAFFVSCKSNDDTKIAEKDPQQTSIGVDSSANINLAKKVNDLAMKFDYEGLKSNFIPKAKLHDNSKDITIEDNIATLKMVQKEGIVISVNGKPLFHEVIMDKPNPKTGISNYVICYYDVTFAKGDKKVNIKNYHMLFAIKDGKVHECWDIYDASELPSLFQ